MFSFVLFLSFFQPVVWHRPASCVLPTGRKWDVRQNGSAGYCTWEMLNTALFQLDFQVPVPIYPKFISVGKYTDGNNMSCFSLAFEVISKYIQSLYLQKLCVYYRISLKSAIIVVACKRSVEIAKLVFWLYCLLFLDCYVYKLDIQMRTKI